MEHKKVRGKIEERACWMLALTKLREKGKIENELFDEIITEVVKQYKEGGAE